MGFGLEYPWRLGIVFVSVLFYIYTLFFFSAKGGFSHIQNHLDYLFI